MRRVINLTQPNLESDHCSERARHWADPSIPRSQETEISGQTWNLRFLKAPAGSGRPGFTTN
jgi:hypothetical protein